MRAPSTLRSLRSFTSLALLGAALLAIGCGDREAVWDAVSGTPVSHGLDSAAVFVDSAAERLLFLPVEGDLTLSPSSLPIRRGFAMSSPTRDGNGLLVLAHGDVPRNKADAQGPSLELFDAADTPRSVRSYDLSDPLSGLATDPEGHFAVVYPSASDDSFVANPNELSIIDLDRGAAADNPVPLTLRSFGGRPEGLLFSPTLALPGGARRLLVVLTDRDAGIIDLSHPELGDITVRLSSTGQKVTPAQVVVSDGDPARSDDARLAIRIANDPSVILVDLPATPENEAATSAHDFHPTPNVVLASGVPSDITFVNTDGGLRLAALVPAKSSLSLIDPATGISSEVALGVPFDQLSLVTGIVGSTESGADVALLWSRQSPYIGFVALGSTVGKPYKSVEKLELEQPIAAVLDVPKPNDRLKILAAADGQSFFVLDLVARTAAPILSNGYGVNVTLSPDGQRAWLFAPGYANLASLDLGSLHPKNLVLGGGLSAAFDVRRRDGGRAVIAVHPEGDLGLTVLDALNPSLESAVEYHGVLLGNLR
ncbi:MAG: hypothetical protein U0359_33770 [Byssovorax sp.]